MPRMPVLALGGAMLLACPVAWAAASTPAGNPLWTGVPAAAAPSLRSLRPAVAESPPVSAPDPRGSAAANGAMTSGATPSVSMSNGATPSRATTTGATPPARWTWPVTPRPAVVRPFDAPAQPWLAGHRGVDLQAAPGAAVRAPAGGVVAFRGMVAGRPVISIDHAGGIRSTYEPVLSTLTPGSTVGQGQVIGTLDTGHTCPAPTCLHWGARRGETYLDPLRLLGAGAPILLPLR